MKAYTCLATFIYPHETLVIKSALDAEDIRYFFLNETLIGLIPFSSYAFGGIKLMVHPSDIKKAKHILDSFKDRPPHLKVV